MRKLIGLVGETGSGKDDFCKHAKRFLKPIYSFRFSTPLTEALEVFFPQVKKEDQQWLANNLRSKFGSDILARAIQKKIMATKEGTVIVNGVRVWEEYNMIRKMGGKIVYITADSRLRWQRVQGRKEKKDDALPYSNFLKLEKGKPELLIGDIGKKADFKIVNNGTKKAFYKEIEKVIKSI